MDYNFHLSYFFGISKSSSFFCFLLSSRGTHIRPLPVFKPAGSPTANRDAELYAPYRTPPRAASSTNSSCNSSPTSRCQTWLSCHALLIITERRLCFLKLREKKFSRVSSWSRLTFPHFSTWIRYKSNLRCLREKQGDFGDLRDLDCGSGNVQHNDEWVGGWIKLRLLSFPLLQPAGIISVMIWLCLGLMRI